MRDDTRDRPFFKGSKVRDLVKLTTRESSVVVGDMNAQQVRVKGRVQTSLLKV
jgi:hypothetical protein